MARNVGVSLTLESASRLRMQVQRFRAEHEALVIQAAVLMARGRVKEADELKLRAQRKLCAANKYHGEIADFFSQFRPSTLRVVVAGRSGVGKSTLVNAILRRNVARTGDGRPVTERSEHHSDPSIPLSFVDTRGLELAAFERTLDELNVVLTRYNRKMLSPHRIGVGWLCIAEGSRRIEGAESEVGALLAAHVPLVVAITKARSDNGFAAEVRRLLPQASAVVRVRAIAEVDDDGRRLPGRGLPDLVAATSRAFFAGDYWKSVSG